MPAGYITPILTRNKQSWLAATDRRTKATIDVVASIKSIKAYGVVQQVGDEIQKLRESEVTAFRYAPTTISTSSFSNFLKGFQI